MIYLAPLTSLRFFAAAMVVLMHARSMFKFEFIGESDLYAFAVPFFFVLSGFILMHRYGSGGSIKFGDFMKARFSRLWPAHLFWTLAAIILLPIGGAAGIRVGEGVFGWWPTLGLNLSLLHAWSPFRLHSYSFNGVSWSISTEMMLYCFFPILLPGIKKNWPWKILATLSLLVALTWVGTFFPEKSSAKNLNSTSFSYTFPLARVFEFCVGMVAWVFWDSLRMKVKEGVYNRSAFELAAFVVFLLVILVADYYYHKALLVAQVLAYCALAVLLVSIATGGGCISKILSFRPLVYLGEISFSLYLSHQVIMRCIISVRGDYPLLKQLDGVGLFVFIFCVSLAASIITFHLIEGPCRKMLMKAFSYRKDDGGTPPVAIYK